MTMAFPNQVLGFLAELATKWLETDRASRARLDSTRRVLTSLDCAAVEVDARGSIVAANDRARARLVATSDEIVGMALWALAVDATALASLWAATGDGRAARAEVELLSDVLGETISDVVLSPLRHGGRRIGALVEFRPVTRRRRQTGIARVRRTSRGSGLVVSHRRLAQSYVIMLKLGAALVRRTSAAIFALDVAAVVETIGDGAPVQLAIASCESLVRRGLDGTSEAIGAPVRAFGSTVGSVCFVGARSLPRRHAFEREAISLVATLVGLAIENDSARSRFERLASIDGTTGLAHRAAFLEDVAAEIACAQDRKSQFGIVMIGLDHFKRINDAAGHDVGDATLRDVAALIAGSVRDGDTVARLAGDQFVVLIGADSSANQATAVAERLRAAIAARSREAELTASIGVAVYPEDGADIDRLLRMADAAMNDAKQSGRNRVVCASTLTSNRTCVATQTELRRAIAAGELEMRYQPQHDCFSGDIYAVEALVRWNHPLHGMLLPAAFVAEAEKSDAINDIGDFVMQRVCSDIAALRALFPSLRASLNLSARNFRQHHLAEKLVGFAEEACVVPSALELEITETIAMVDAALTTTILDELHELGFGLSLDDFGTGYSSLGYLRQFPVHALKIDHSFVADLPSDQGCVTIVRAVIAMAHALGLEVVAEGVEKTEQLDFLRAERCDRWQGFLGAPALLPSDLIAYLEAAAGGLTEPVRPSDASAFSLPRLLTASPLSYTGTL